MGGATLHSGINAPGGEYVSSRCCVYVVICDLLRSDQAPLSSVELEGKAMKLISPLGPGPSKEVHSRVL